MGIKKKKKSKKQPKTAPNRHIQKSGLESSTQPLSDLQGEITEDIVYFFRSFPDAMRSPQMATEALIKAVLPTEKIAMEPEFDDIVGDPISCTLIYSEAISKMDVNWETFGNLPPQLAASIRLQVLEETIRHFLTESLRLEILDGLNLYRLRKKRSGEKMETGIAAALQLVLKDEKNNPIWPKIGLLLGIARNSISLGLEIKDSFNEILNENKDLLISDNQKRYEILKKACSKIDANPRLINFFNRQSKRIYDEGAIALREGKLCFGFLSVEELNKLSENIIESFGFSNKEKLNDLAAIQTGLIKKKLNKLIAGMYIFIKDIFTPEKIEQMVQKLNSISKDPGDLKRWVPFILMMINTLQSDDTSESLKILCIFITLGEFTIFMDTSENHETSIDGSKKMGSDKSSKAKL
jgi:hypothetical protein